MAELYKSVTELMKTARGNKALQDNLGDIIDFQQIIDDTPTADVVEVVRCKDCRHSREQNKVFGITDYKCLKHNISCLSPYDFCSYGERRDT